MPFALVKQHLICTTGSHLHHQDLASCIREHFQAQLDQVEMQEKAKDREPECNIDVMTPLDP